jgi:4-hydroxybutyrate CoA-transferase
LDWKARYADKLVSPAEAAASVCNGETVYIGMFTSCPLTFATALSKRAGELDDVTIHHHVANFPWRESTEGRFNILTGFVTPVDRGHVASGLTDYFPVGAFHPGKFIDYAPPVDTMAVTLSPPDENGYLSYGTAVWLNPSYAKKAKRIIGEVDPRLIRTFGENYLHISEIDLLIEHDEADDRAPAIPPRSQEVEDAANVICALVASELINDGDCLQTGIGDVSAALGLVLDDKHDLGVQSEMLGGGFVDLVDKGIVTGRYKQVAPGKVVASAVVQAPPDEVRRIHMHPRFELWDFCHTDDLRMLVQNPNFVAINNALFMDVTGQVTAESMGPQVFSGPGGQTVFAVAANYSDGGRSIQVLPSSSVVNGERRPRILPVLPEGTSVTVPRTYVDYVVTEQGIATLRGKTLRQRIEEMVAVAHPDHRAELRREARRIHGV